MKVKLTRPDYVIFDMDGTTVRHVNPALLNILEAIDNILYKITSFIIRKRDIEDFSEQPVKTRGLLVHRVMHKLRRKEVSQIVQPCPGIFLLLNLFKRHNIPMAIASNGLGQGYGHDILKSFDLADYFEVELFREDIQKSKPHPDAVLRALRSLKKPPSAGDVVWFIGDRHTDMSAAIEANRLSDAKIMPFSYGLNAAVILLKNKIAKEQIIVSYHDFYVRIYDLFKSNQEESA